MAELAVKIGDGAHYRDGDILAAFNSRRIRCVHAQHICHVTNAGGGIGGLRDKAHVARDWFEHTHKYRFERVSRTEVRRITLATLDEVVIDATPKLVEGRMQYMDVPLYIDRRLASKRHKIFGGSGAEIWYGGKQELDNIALDKVWTAIESKTAFREVGFLLWPAGEVDLKVHLFITVNNFDEIEADDLVSSELDLTDPGEPVTIKKRRHFIAWRDVVKVQNYEKIEDRAVSVNFRETMVPLIREGVVKTHALALI